MKLTPETFVRWFTIALVFGSMACACVTARPDSHSVAAEHAAPSSFKTK